MANPPIPRMKDKKQASRRVTHDIEALASEIEEEKELIARF